MQAIHSLNLLSSILIKSVIFHATGAQEAAQPELQVPNVHD